MAITPTQIRTLDSYSDHRFSNIFSNFSKIVTGGRDLILPFDGNVFQMEIGDDDQSVVISPGLAVKDGILIHIQSEATLDFTDDDNYIGEQTDLGPPPSHPIKYFILLSYNYVRSLPSPEASYVIAKDRNAYLNFKDKYIYLGSANVELVVDQYEITEIFVEDVDENDSDAPITRPYYTFHIPNLDCGELDE